MKFKDTFFSRENRFSVGIEEESGKCYLSIPVSNLLADYEEYYEIDQYEYERMNIKELLLIADNCKKRKNDRKLIIQPGTDRGTPS
jgi:hypothetical protein